MTFQHITGAGIYNTHKYNAVRDGERGGAKGRKEEENMPGNANLTGESQQEITSCSDDKQE